MRGWTEEQGVIAREGRTIFRCEAPLCRAHVGVSEGEGEKRLRQHDREFHLLRAERGGPMDGYDLYLDGKNVGYIYKKRTTYNLVRYLVDERWVARLNGQREIDGGGLLSGAMSEALRALDGAKAWGRGKNPTTWIYPERDAR